MVARPREKQPPKLRGLTVKQYAKRLGISAPAVRQSEKRGLIVRHKDGSINVHGSGKLRDANIGSRTDGGGNTAPNPLDALAAKTHAGDLVITPILTVTAGLNAEKAAHEKTKHELTRAKLNKLTSAMVDRDEAQRAWFALARSLRDRMRAIPARLAGPLAALTDEHEIRTRLAAEIDDALTMTTDEIQHEAEA